MVHSLGFSCLTTSLVIACELELKQLSIASVQIIIVFAAGSFENGMGKAYHKNSHCGDC